MGKWFEMKFLPPFFFPTFFSRDFTTEFSLTQDGTVQGLVTGRLVSLLLAKNSVVFTTDPVVSHYNLCAHGCGTALQFMRSWATVVCLHYSSQSRFAVLCVADMCFRW